MFQKEAPDKALIKKLYTSFKRSVNDYCTHQCLSLMSPASHAERNFVPYPCKHSSFQGVKGWRTRPHNFREGKNCSVGSIWQRRSPWVSPRTDSERFSPPCIHPSMSHLVLQQPRGGVKPPIKLEDWKEVPEVFLPKYLWQETSVTALQQSEKLYLRPSQSYETCIISAGPFYHDILARKKTIRVKTWSELQNQKWLQILPRDVWVLPFLSACTSLHWGFWSCGASWQQHCPGVLQLAAMSIPKDKLTQKELNQLPHRDPDLRQPPPGEDCTDLQQGPLTAVTLIPHATNLNVDFPQCSSNIFWL